MAKENREHKSSVFADLFYYDESAKKNLLDLHNALYGTAYSDPGVVDLIGLEDVLFRNFKNDVAFSVDGQSIVLSEHQSTINPNMPVRDLLYIAREYEKVIPIRSRYKTTLLKIPTPRFLVFYNGTRNQPLEQVLRLSDAFMEATREPSLELTVRVININSNKHHEILTKCNVLREYSLFVETARKHQNDANQLKKAVSECIKNGILADYLSRKSSEVINMLMAEYDYETDIAVQREEAAKEANERAEKEAKRADEAVKKAEEANQKLASIISAVEKAAENFQLPIEEVCKKMELPYEEYLTLKNHKS